MPDVILPVLNERAALPDVLKSLPAGYRAIVVVEPARTVRGTWRTLRDMTAILR